MTAKTIVALYDDLTSAQSVLNDLHTAGLRNDFTMMGAEHARTGVAAGTGWSGGEWRHAATPGADLNESGNRVTGLTRLGVPHGDAETFAEGVRRGGVLLVGRVDDTRCDEALGIIERHNPVDIEHRHRSYRESGWTGYDAGASDYDETQATEERTRYGAGGTGLGAAAASFRDTNVRGTERTTRVDEERAGNLDETLDATATGRTAASLGSDREERIPVVEEQIDVGKRTVERGGVRVRSYMIETPVEEQVTLRDESVTVERRAVDRAAGDIPADAFRERTIEVTETDEEPVVEKATRIREEVVIRKDVQERTEAVSDTVRRTEVEIDDNRTGGDRTATDRDRSDV